MGEKRGLPSTAELTRNLIEECRATSLCEKHLVMHFLRQEKFGFHETAIPMGPNDRIVREMSVKYGRADLVVFHEDGSASVIEAKDGSKGYSHVMSGVGQAGLYALQLSMHKGALKRVRRCLLWSSTGDLMLDTLIHIACEQAGVVPIPAPSLRQLHQIAKESMQDLLDEGVSHG